MRFLLDYIPTYVFFSDQTLCNYKVTKVLRTFPFNFVDHRSQKNQKKSLPGSKLTFVQHFKALNFEEKPTKESENCLFITSGQTILKCEAIQNSKKRERSI